MKIIFTAVALFTALTFTPAWALFETDKQLSDKARVSMTDALKTAEGAVLGSRSRSIWVKTMGKSSIRLKSSTRPRKHVMSTSMQSRESPYGQVIPQHDERPPSGGRSWWDPFIMSYLMWLLIGSLVGVLTDVNNSEGRTTITVRRRE